MKKTRIVLICTIVVVFACICFAGCAKTEKITSIALKDNSPDVAVEMLIGDFDYSEHTLLVNYDSGSVVEVALSEDMISELDRLKFYQPGDHTITVSYFGKSYEFKISVRRQSFGELKFPENNVFTYDGKEHTVELIGDLPSNATVSYIGGNSFVNAGTYNVTAVVACNGYVTERIATTVVIERAKYDMSNIKFEPLECVYDGKEHSVEITGQLPVGVLAPTYYINGNKISSAVDAGTYKVTAVFKSNDPNYDPIPSMETTLTITPAEYNIEGVDMVFRRENGQELYFPLKSYDGTSVTFELKDNGALKNKVSVSYTVRNEKGEVISVSNTRTNIVDAGEYTITVNFSLLDGKNYKAIEPMEWTFDVNQAELDTSELRFESGVIEYNGEMQSLEIAFPDSLDATKIDISYEYYYPGSEEVIKDGDGNNVIGVTDAGEYTVKAIFKVNDTNYKQIPSMQAKLVIERQAVSASQFEFYNTNLTYSGNSLRPTFGFESLEAVKIRSIYVSAVDGDQYTAVSSAIDVGDYIITAVIDILDTKNYVFDNNRDSIEVTEEFTIHKAEIDISQIGFKSNNNSLVFKGNVATVGFNTKNVEGLLFEATFYKVEGERLISVSEIGAVVPGQYGIVNAELDTAGLDEGEYVCVVSVSVADSNHVLSSGEVTADYSFEFSVADN